MLLAYFAALIPALVMAITQPVWSLVDEAQHTDFIAQLSHGVYPIADRTPIDPETLRVSESAGVFRAFYPPGSYPTPDLTDVGLPPPGMSDSANAVWMMRHLWQLSHESVQTPAYYVAMAPVWWVADRLGGPFAAIYALRLINALIIATLAPMAVIVARILIPARPEVAVLAALLAILLPGLDLNGTRVSNDALAAALGGLLVLLAVLWAGSAWTWRRAVVIGLLLGLGLMVKLTIAGLFPALVVSALWPVPGTTWRGRMTRVAVAGAIAVVCLGPWLLLNLHNYAGLTPGARGARLSDAAPGPLTAAFIPLDVAVFELTYWTGEPWGALPLAGPFAVLGGLIALAVPAGLIKLLRTRPLAASAGPLAVVIVAIGAMVGVTLLLPAGGGFEFVGPGRYAYPALPAAAALCAIGIVTVLTRAFAQKVVGTVYGVMAVAILAAGAAGFPLAPGAGTGAPPRTANVVDVTASGEFHGLTINIDRVALDPTARATWFEVSATNSGPDEVEWTVPPVASTADAVVKGSYLRSTHLPGDIDPGQTVSGWLFVPLDPASLHGSRSVRVHFADVAVQGYGAIGAIDLDVPWSATNG